MKRKSYTAELKARVAIEAIRGLKTTNEIATEYGVHPNLVGKWKKLATESLPALFSERHEKSQAEDGAKLDSLYQQIGQLQVELSFLKKRTGFAS